MSDDVRTVTLEVTKIKFKGDRNFIILEGIIRDNPSLPSSVGSKLDCKGNAHEIVEGAHYVFTGVPKWDERYQKHHLLFSKCDLSQTSTLTGLESYLAKECEHIGPGRANQIVKLYGDKTMHVLIHESEKLIQDVTGIGPVEAKVICEWAKAEQEVSTVKNDLYAANLTSGLIRSLITAYGSDVSRILRENAFDTTEIKGIGFLTADKIAKKFGMPATHQQRIREGVKYALQEVMEECGHTCVEHHVLVNATCKLLEIHKEHVIEIIKQMLVTKELCTQRDDPAGFSRFPFLFEKDS